MSTKRKRYSSACKAAPTQVRQTLADGALDLGKPLVRRQEVSGAGHPGPVARVQPHQRRSEAGEPPGAGRQRA
jgi:hypothetical protein